MEDTWTYDGTTWTRQSPANSPSARHGASMAFDQATGQIVLFGGSTGSTNLGETWTFAGGNWTQRSPSTSPSPRQAASMSFDLDSGLLVLFGGVGGNGLLGDSWTYDGTNWTEVKPPASPPARREAAMTFDQTIGKTILVGGSDGSHPRDDVWTYEKGSWTKLEIAPTPPSRAGASLEFDPASGEAVLFGGSGNNGDLSDTWSYGPPSSPPEGSPSWQLQLPERQPCPRTAASMAFDPAIGQMLFFGGECNGALQQGTWTYDGENWTRQSPQTSPHPRSEAAMAYDPAIGKMVLFGGSEPGFERPWFGDTWTYDGKDWTELTPAHSPSPRDGASMAYDPVTGQLVLFGGQGEGEDRTETWTFDGKDWKELQDTRGPYAHFRPGMVFDPAIGKIVLFGGSSYNDDLRDTWTYDAHGWTYAGNEGPEVFDASTMTFDASIGRIVLYGRNPREQADHLWTYDGTRWVQEGPANSPDDEFGASFVFDPTTGRTLLFGRSSFFGEYSATWTLQRPVSAPQPKPHPRPTIAEPFGHIYGQGEVVESHFYCEDVEGGPGIRSCADSGGASEPHGFLDTSTLGYHTYSVKAESKDGDVGFNEYDYLVKARPTVTVEAPASVPPGMPITATATLSGGDSPRETLEFIVYGPNSHHCQGTVAFDSKEIAVSGNGTYEMDPTYTPKLPGVYIVAAHYSGDESNLEGYAGCGGSDNTVTVGKVTTSTQLEVSPNPDRAGELQRLEAQVTGSEPSGTITFKDGSEVIRVENIRFMQGSAGFYTSLSPGKHELSAVYSGDEVNPPSTSPVVEEEIIKPKSPPPSEPEEPSEELEEPSPPHEPSPEETEDPLPPAESEETLPPAEPEEPVSPGSPVEPVTEKPKESLPPREVVEPPTASSPTVVAPPSILAPPAVTSSPPPTAPAPATAPVVTSAGVAVSHRVRASHDGPHYVFTFTSPLSGPNFFCDLDRAALAPCHSPTTYRHLTGGAHRFVVKAVGPSGVESTPQVVRFFVGRHPR